MIFVRHRRATRIGETVPPQIMPMLRHLGLTADFAADRHHASYRTMSAWGSRALLSNEFLFQIHQTGWRLDRARFDAMLLRAAARNATVISGSATRLDRHDGLWRVQLADGREPTARGAWQHIHRWFTARPVVVHARRATMHG